MQFRTTFDFDRKYLEQIEIWRAENNIINYDPSLILQKIGRLKSNNTRDHAANVMVPTTLQNTFSLTFQNKMNRFPWLICSCEIPMLAFNHLQ